MNTEQSTELSLIDEAMPKDISAETRAFINAVAVVKDLEQQLPLIETIEEVENLRSQTIAVARWAEEKQKIDSTVKEWKELHQWAVRVSMMCQRRVGQILKTLDLKSGRPKNKSSSARTIIQMPAPPTLAELGLSRNYASDAKTLAAIPEEKLGQKIEAQIAEDGRIKKQRLIKQIRAEARRKGEPIDEKTARDRARWRLSGEKKQSAINKERAKEAPRQRESPSDKFKAYWTKEKKLLYTSFDTSDLQKVGDYWWREFHAYRFQAEKILSEARQERERKKALVELAKS